MIDRSGKKDGNLAGWVLGLLLVLGALLRLLGIRFGLPMAYHNDEWVLVLATRQFFGGDFNPHNFLYPSLLMYIMYLIERIYFLFFSGRDDLSTLYTICRVTVVLFGLASLWATARLGRKLYDRRVGLVAAFLLTVSPLHVIHSHFATTDVPLTFFLILTLWATLRLVDERTTAAYVLTGLFFGLTVSIKIPGAVVFLAILTAHLHAVAKTHQLQWLSILSREWRAGRRLLITAAIAAFLATALFLLLHHFEHWAGMLLNTIRVELWIKYFDEIVPRVHAMAPKLAAVVFAGVMVLGYTLRLWLPEIRRILLLVGVAVFAFFVTTPYAILDHKAFLHDFLFQMVISQSSWSGMFAASAPGYITNFFYLHDNFGTILMAAAVAGLLLSLWRAKISWIVVAVYALTYYFYLGSWRLMFDRYMVPMLPILALWAGLAIVRAMDWLALKIRPAVARAGVLAGMVAVFLLIPAISMLQKSYAFDAYLLKTQTRKLAYNWAVANLPQEARILREQYTPELELAGYAVHNVNFTFADSVNEAYVRRHDAEYLIVSDKLWKRPIQEDGILAERKAYAEIDTYADLIYHLKPTPQHPGPEIKIFKVREP